MKNKVTIIIPVYNAEKSIEKCILSVENQTYKNIEILAINDGSKDKSIDILEKLAKEYKNITVINKENEGVARTRNLGIKKATGDYIMFIDNDDYVDEDYVESYISQINNDDYDIVLGGYRRENQFGQIISTEVLKESAWSKYIILAPWAKLYKRLFLINNDVEFFSYKIGEDVYFNLLAYSKKPKIKIIKNKNYVWFFNEESVSNTKQRGLKKYIDIFFMLDKIVSFVDLNDPYINYFIERYIIWYLLFSGRYANRKAFNELYKKSQKWMKKNNIVSKLNLVTLKGESLKNKFIIDIFRIIKKLNLVNLFSLIYCRGD